MGEEVSPPLPVSLILEQGGKSVVSGNSKDALLALLGSATLSVVCSALSILISKLFTRTVEIS